MNTHATRRPRRPWIGLLGPALLLLALFIALGTWQLQRKTWKENLIATLTDRLAAAPIALPAPETWPSLTAANDEYRRVAFSAEFDNSKEALVYAAASAFRPDVDGPGYWVFTPARLADGAYVIVNRGFVPDTRKAVASRQQGELAGKVGIVGVMRWPDTRTWFSPADDPAHNVWFARDPKTIAAAQGIGSAAPFYVEQESPAPPGGLPQPGKLVVHLRNQHLGYAVTWYGLALVLVVAFAVWAPKSGREARPGTAGDA